MKIESRRLVPQSRNHGRRLLLPLCVIVLTACAAGSLVAVPVVVPVGSGDQTIRARTGQEIEVLLGNVGPGVYESPPLISSGALTYLGVDIVPPFTPAGPTQRFRFSAVGTGQAIVVFRRTLADSVIAVVEDTVQVR
jgi:hypothetical protein